MNHHKVLGLLAIGLVSMGLAVTAAEEKKGESKKRNTLEGTIVKVDPSANRLTVRLIEKIERQVPRQREFSIGPATKFIFLAVEGKPELGRKEAYKHEQLKEGARVTVLSDDENVRVTEVRVGSAKPEEKKK